MTLYPTYDILIFIEPKQTRALRVTNMSTLTARLAEVTNKQNSTIVMWSADGANFQEWAINNLDHKNSVAHKLIGSLVTAINNNNISVENAKQQFIAALSN